jgi:allantoinase
VALWGGLVPGDLDRLDELAARGVVGFKAFMSASGVAEFQAADDLTLLEGMTRAARLGSRSPCTPRATSSRAA